MQTVRRTTLVVSVSFPILAIITVCLRFYARRARKLAFLADDWSILLALVCTVFASILTFYGDFARGLGLGPAEVHGEQSRQAYKVFYAIMLFVYLTFGIVKISALLFYNRIFREPRFRLASTIMMAIVVAWTIALFIVQALNSWNTPGFWNFKLLDYAAFNITMAVLDFVFDILILLLPIPVISKLQLGKRQKYSIIGIFWLGAICVIASALRIYYTHAFLSINATSSEAWITTVASANSLWLIVEANVSIIAACLPTLGGFIKSRLGAQDIEAGSKYATTSARTLSQPLGSKGKGMRSVSISGERRNTWVPLKDMSIETNVLKEESEEKGICPERARAIMVERTFVTESRPRT